MSLNVVNLVGRAGMDPDIKLLESANGPITLCKLTMAVNRATSKNDQPDWFNLEIWGKTAEIAANFVRKGSLIGIQGSLKIETWQDLTTRTTRSKPVIKVDRLDLLGSKRDNETASSSMGNYTENTF